MRTNHLIPLLTAIAFFSPQSQAQNLFSNPDFEQHTGNQVVNYQLTGEAAYRNLTDRHESAGFGVVLNSAKPDSSGAVSQAVTGIDPKAGRWFRFSVRALPQDNFVVRENDLYMRVEFFGNSGKTSYDEKAQKIYSQIERARKDLSVNGPGNTQGAAAWRTFQMDFYLPFPQVDEIRATVGFGQGAAKLPNAAALYVDEFSLTRIPDPPTDGAGQPRTGGAVVPHGKLIPIGGRWFYDAPEGVTSVPAQFDHTNADRLLYHDNIYSAPFAGNMTATLKSGEMDLFGNILLRGRPLLDNVTVRFDATSLIIHTHGIPNHPTGRFPSYGPPEDGNPNYIQEQDSTYYLPLNPRENPRHFTTTKDNSNHALPMGPIGVAVNGVVFYNPFDAGNQDATNLMDLCCGHPNPDGQYHYHKYPICINSPWADNGDGPSPLIGWAFDGFPIYGPYESANVMAKDLTGANALNAFNMHNDPERGWHYNVTPGKFPYIIGGYWGTEDSRDMHGPPGGGRGMGRGGPGRGPPPF
jgi:hypothetical protein